MLGNLSGWHLIIVLAIVLLLFGATKLPALSKSVGQSIKIFRGEVRDIKTDVKKDKAADAASTTSTFDETFADVTPTSTENKPKA